MNSGSAPPSGAQSVVRAARLLAAVAQRGADGARLTELASEMGLHVATARRILQTLVSERLLFFDSVTSRYTIGSAVYACALSGSAWFSRRETFAPALERVARETGDTVLLSIRSGDESVCLGRREGKHPIRVMTLDVGARRPLGVGSGSAALLAFLDPVDRDAIVERSAAAWTEFGLSREQVEGMVAEAETAGYSYNPGLLVPGVGGVAVPILSGGVAVAAISVAATLDRLEPPRRRMVVETIHHALHDVPDITLPTMCPVV